MALGLRTLSIERLSKLISLDQRCPPATNEEAVSRKFSDKEEKVTLGKRKAGPVSHNRGGNAVQTWKTGEHEHPAGKEVTQRMRD